MEPEKNNLSDNSGYTSGHRSSLLEAEALVLYVLGDTAMNDWY